MPILSLFAEYFIFWWITLFIVLPFGLRTQEEEQSVVKGTVRSAPARFRFWKTFAWTSAIAATLYAAFYVITEVLGFDANSIPRIVPDL